MPLPPASNPNQWLRLLPPVEWPRIADVFTAQGTTLPDPDSAHIIVLERLDTDAFRDIVGFIVIQLVPHLEPVYVKKAFRGTEAFKDLAKAAISLFPPGEQFYAFAPNQNIEQMALSVGLVKLPWSVLRGAGQPPQV